MASYKEPEREVTLAGRSRTLLVTAGTGKADSLEGLSLSRQSEGWVKAFVGVHPSEAEREPHAGWVSKALREASGLGEVGLDPKYSAISEGSSQSQLLLEQLGAAEREGKPVQLHSRGAERECLDVLSQFRLNSVLLHWFQGETLASEASQKGFFASFGPALLFSKRIQRIARSWSEDRMLTESDGPVAFSGLGGASGPSTIPSVVLKVAELRGRSFDDMEALMLRNGLSFLGSKA